MPYFEVLLVWDSQWVLPPEQWNWLLSFTCVTHPALTMFSRTRCCSFWEFSTSTLEVRGPQLAVVFFQSSYWGAFLCKTSIACLSRKQWASVLMVLKKGVSFKTVDLILLLVLFMVVPFSLPQSKCNSLFFCSFPARNGNVYPFLSHSI